MASLDVSAIVKSANLLAQEQMEQVQQTMKQRLCSFEEAVLSLQLLPKSSLYGAIADQMRVPYVDLDEYLPDPGVRDLVPEKLIRQHRAMPLFSIQKTLIVAMSDPANLAIVDALRQVTGHPIEGYYSPEAEINRAVERKYGAQGDTQRFLEEMAAKPIAGAPAAAKVEAPVTKLVDLILNQAVKDRASDIHIEPEETSLRVRFRIDGVLHEIPGPPKSMEAAIISRLKVMGELDIAESRIPQDGHFQIKTQDKRIDMRLSTLPTIYGENVVVRILDPAGLSIGLERLGFSPEAVSQFEEVIKRPYGIILSTGPTGSGKTTTLYSALMRISSVDQNIVTVEDPVEYRLGLIRQVQVNPKAGLTFSSGLRSILRQDPDVIMVGEIRDLETAEIAIQSALTGHLVFSTLHTNDAPSAVTRLINMGVEPFLVSASLTCIIAQRLIRTICKSCKTGYEPTPAMLKQLGKLAGSNPKLAKGAGCAQCKGTGYSGRSGLYEMMLIDDELREIILANVSVAQLRESARAKGMHLLWEEGVSKALAGVTTLEEILRVCEQKN